MLKYGNDKPDLRIPLEISDVTGIFRDSDFAVFAKAIAGGGGCAQCRVRKCGSRAICDRMNSWAQGEGARAWATSSSVTAMRAAQSRTA